MTAVLIPTGSEAEWLEARRAGITASEIAIVMGLSPYSSPYALYHQKLGILPSDVDSDVMERGRVLEPHIAEKFAALHPELAVERDGRTLFAHRDRPWQLATPDRLTRNRGNRPMDYQCCDWHKPGKALPGGMAACCDPNDCGSCCDDCPTCPANNRLWPTAVLECKVDGGSDDWGEPGTDEIPVHYRAQVLWQCRVLGVRRWHAGCFNADRWKARWYEGVIDDAAEADLELMEGEALGFLGRLESGDAPDVDWRPATISALKTLHPSVEDTTAEIGPQLADRYESACRNLRRWEQRKKLYEARIRLAAGPARRVVRKGPGQVPVARRDVYEVRESVRKAYTVDKLVSTPPKEKKHDRPDSQ